MTILTRLTVLPIAVLAAAFVGWVLQFLWGLSDGIRARSSKTTKRFMVVALLLAGAGACGGYLGRNIIMRQYDAARLARFARRIAATDRVVATCVEDRSIRLTFMGDAAKRVAGAVSSGGSARLPGAEFAAAYDVFATFYRGSNVLGQIKLCGSLFLLDSNESPCISGSLEAAVYKPVLEALRESYAHHTR